jgi:hypothetical protein
MVVAWPAISLASCSARDCKEASMRQSPYQEKGYQAIPSLLADTRSLTGPVQKLNDCLKVAMDIT